MPTGAFVVRRNGKVFVTGNSGFPKSHDVSKAIDKLAGAEREVVSEGTPVKRMIPGADQNKTGSWIKDNGRTYTPAETSPATPEAKQWSGWGTALKPAFEPIVLARKPLDGTVANNVLEHGTGGINIDATRIATDELKPYSPGLHRDSPSTYNDDSWGGREEVKPAPAGRFPANVLLDEHAAAWVDEQSGHQKDGVAVKRNRDGKPQGVSSWTLPGNALPDQGYGGQGGASRFFYNAKAPKSERPVIEREDGTKIQHPTVKPLAIMRWLTRLITPPGGTVLDPFAGSGTTIEAAMMEGFHPVGIEMETDYLPLITARIARAKTSAQETLDLGGVA